MLNQGSRLWQGLLHFLWSGKKVLKERWLQVVEKLKRYGWFNVLVFSIVSVGSAVLGAYLPFFQKMYYADVVEEQQRERDKRDEKILDKSTSTNDYILSMEEKLPLYKDLIADTNNYGIANTLFLFSKNYVLENKILNILVTPGRQFRYNKEDAKKLLETTKNNLENTQQKLKESWVEFYLVSGQIELWDGRLAEAISYYDKAYELKKDDPRILYKKAHGLFLASKYDEAGMLFEQGISLQEKYQSQDASLAGAYQTLGEIYRIKERYNDAEKKYKEALKLMKNPSYFPEGVPKYWDIVSNNARQGLAIIYVRQGRDDLAYPFSKEVVDSFDGLSQENRYILVDSKYLFLLGALYLRQGNYVEAKKLLIEANAILTWHKKLIPNVTQLMDQALITLLLGLNYDSQDQLDIAEKHYKRAYDTIKQALRLREIQADSRLSGASEYTDEDMFYDEAASLVRLGNLYVKQKKFLQAEQYLDNVRQIAEQKVKNEMRKNELMAGSLYGHGEMYLVKRDFLKAKQSFEEALEKLNSPENSSNILRATVLMELGSVYHMEDNYPEAKRFYESSKGIWEKSAPEHPQFGMLLENYVLLLSTMNQPVDPELKIKVQKILDK